MPGLLLTRERTTAEQWGFWVPSAIASLDPDRHSGSEMPTGEAEGTEMLHRRRHRRGASPKGLPGRDLPIRPGKARPDAIPHSPLSAATVPGSLALPCGAYPGSAHPAAAAVPSRPRPGEPGRAEEEPGGGRPPHRQDGTDPQPPRHTQLRPALLSPTGPNRRVRGLSCYPLKKEPKKGSLSSILPFLSKTLHSPWAPDGFLSSLLHAWIYIVFSCDGLSSSIPSCHLQLRFGRKKKTNPQAQEHPHCCRLRLSHTVVSAHPGAQLTTPAPLEHPCWAQQQHGE